MMFDGRHLIILSLNTYKLIDMNRLIIITDHKDDKWWENFKEVDVNLLEEIKRNSPGYSAIFITEETIITKKDKKNVI